MMNKILTLAAALGLTLSCAAASATVEVRFVEPDKYSDAGDRWGHNDREQVLKSIQAHLRQLGDKRLAGKDLVIEITDVDLAGELEPVGRYREMLRVLRGTGRPAMELRYVLREDGKDLRQGNARLSDLSYLDGFNRYAPSDPIRYEKRMIDEWFSSEFAPVPQKVGQARR
jgi:hypothetical protein